MYLGTGKRVEASWFHPLQASSKIFGEENGEEQRLGELEEESEAGYHGEEVNSWMDGTGQEEGLGEQEEGNQQEMDIVSEGESKDNDEKETNALKSKLRKAIEAFTENIEMRIDNDFLGYKTSINTFTKQLEKLQNVKKDSALQKTLCSFGKTVTEPLSQGKRKKLGIIPVQVTAKSRRIYKLRGSRTAIMGAPTKSQALKRQLNITDEDEIVRHKVPTLKRPKQKQKHSLENDVGLNRRSSKKH